MIQTLYPDLTDEEQEQVRIGILQSMLITQKGGVVDWEDLPRDANVDMANGAEEESVNSVAGKQFLKMGEKFICIDNLI